MNPSHFFCNYLINPLDWSTTQYLDWQSELVEKTEHSRKAQSRLIIGKFVYPDQFVSTVHGPVIGAVIEEAFIAI